MKLRAPVIALASAAVGAASLISASPVLAVSTGTLCSATLTGPMNVVVTAAGTHTDVSETDNCGGLYSWDVALDDPRGALVTYYGMIAGGGYGGYSFTSFDDPGTYTFTDPHATDENLDTVPVTAPAPIQVRYQSAVRLNYASRAAHVVTLRGVTGQVIKNSTELAPHSESYSVQFKTVLGQWQGIQTGQSLSTGALTASVPERFVHSQYRVVVTQTAVVATSFSNLATPKPAVLPGVSDCYQNRPLIRRKKFTVACGDGNYSATKVRWTYLNPKLGRATAVMIANDCKPNCALGHDHGYRANLVFTRVIKEGGKPAFTRMAVTYLSRTPYGKRHETWKVS